MMFGNRNGKPIHWAEAFGASAVVHLGAAVLVFDLVDLPDFHDQVTPPEIEIEVITLDGDVEEYLQEPLTNDPISEDPAPDPVEPEPALPDPVEPEPVEPEPVEPEPEPEPEPDPVPDEQDLSELVPQTLEPVTPQSAAAPPPLSPLRPEQGTAIPVAPVTSVAPRSDVTVDTIEPVTTTSVQPRQLLPNAPPPTQLAPPPDGAVAGGAVSELVARIRGRLADTCLLALPQQQADGSPELLMMAASEIGIQTFVDEVLDGLEPRPGQRTVLIDNRQCDALNYVRDNNRYPAFQLSVSLDEQTIDSGDELSGTIGNTAGRYVSLLLVDANGVVQDVGQYLSFTGSGARFEIPMRIETDARDTGQILMALATATRPATLSAQNGQLAQDFFAALRSELGSSAPLVLVPFNIR